MVSSALTLTLFKCYDDSVAGLSSRTLKLRAVNLTVCTYLIHSTLYFTRESHYSSSQDPTGTRTFSVQGTCGRLTDAWSATVPQSYDNVCSDRAVRLQLESETC